MKKFLFSFTVLASLLFAAPAFASQGPLLNDACKQAPNSPICRQASQQTAKNDNPVVKILSIAANIIALVAGIVAVIMIIISGFTLVTSGGNQESVTNARRRIIYSLIGLVIIALAWTIIRFITDQVLQ